MKIKISSDSTCDLSQELIERYNVGIVPLTVFMDGQSFHDGVDITPLDIFASVAKSGVLPKTSAISVFEYETFFAEQLKTYDCVIHYCISSKASACYDNACAAAKGFGNKVRVIDSYALSTGQGLLVLKACDLLAEGKSPDEIVNTTKSLINNVNTSFVPDSLEYLHKGGRCSLASMIGAKLLKLHPLIGMKDGQMFAERKLSGSMEKCLKKYITELSEVYTSYDKTRCFITHSYCAPELVKAVKEQVEELFDFDEILETCAGSTITAHCGQNTLGLLFIFN